MGGIMKKTIIILLVLMFGAAAFLYAQSGNLIVNGQLGVGTNSPSHPVDVVGDVNITGNYKINGAIQTGPTFLKARGYRTASLSLPPGAFTVVPIDTVYFDPAALISRSTGEITPTEAGYYQVNASLSISMSESSVDTVVLILKNGALVSAGSGASSTGAYLVSAVSDVIYMNGTTDYLQLAVYTYSGPESLAGLGSVAQNYLSIVGPF